MSNPTFLNNVFLKDNVLVYLISQHFVKPSWSTHVAYCKRVLEISTKNKLCYHVNPSLPIFSLVLDIDSKDDGFACQFGKWLDFGNNKWTNRVQLSSVIREYVIDLYFNYLNIADKNENNVSIFLFESLKEHKDEKKNGFRAVIKCKSVVFRSCHVVFDAIKILQYLFNKHSLLKKLSKDCLDASMYNDGFMFIRCPLNCKSTSTDNHCLVPILNNAKSVKGQLTFSVLLMHNKSLYHNKEVEVIVKVPNVSKSTMRQATTAETIHKRLYKSKFSSFPNRKQNGAASTKRMLKQHTAVTAFINNRHLFRDSIKHMKTKCSMPTEEWNKLKMSSLTKMPLASFYHWCDNVYFCPHKSHSSPQDHPCKYSVRITRTSEKMLLMKVFVWCWGEYCSSQKHKPVCKLVVNSDGSRGVNVTTVQNTD